MNNESFKTQWDIYDCTQLGKIKELEKGKSSPYVGFVYIFEWNNKIKIGSTAHPHKRIIDLRGVKKYGNVNQSGHVAISKECTNYAENERKLHKLFSEVRITGTELFDISFEDIVANIPQIELKNESKQKQEKGESLVEYFKKINTELLDKEMYDMINNHPEEFMYKLLEERYQMDMLAEKLAQIIGFHDPGLFKFYEKYPDAKYMTNEEDEEASYYYADLLQLQR